MYIPKHFKQDDQSLLIEVMRTHNFGLLISTREDGEPFVTHLPFVINEHGEGLRVEGHMARGNPHWRYLQHDARALALFCGPHAYISPSLYESKQSVPTWNYIAVHAYGVVQLVDEKAGKMEAQEKLIREVDPEYQAQFEALDSDFRDQMLSGIVAFTFEVKRLEGKFKLSQNRPAGDRKNVMSVLAKGNTEAQAVAQWMKRLEP